MKAFLYPGQGSQAVGMGLDLIENHSFAKETYAQADEILGFSLSKLSFEGPEDQLTLTENAQPAILTYSYIATRLLKKAGITPDFTAGHSLGEFSALLAADMIGFDDALKLVRKRGELMAKADPEGKGGMAAVLGLSDADVEKICAKASETAYVEPVNYNTPGQVVISGLKKGIDVAEPLLEEAGAMRVVRLNVSGAFHSRLMESAAKDFADYLESVTFNKPSCPVISNVTARPEDEKNVREMLVAQMKSPVQWVKSIQYIKSQGVVEGVEAGYGRVIAGLVRKIDREIKVKNWSKVLE